MRESSFTAIQRALGGLGWIPKLLRRARAYDLRVHNIEIRQYIKNKEEINYAIRSPHLFLRISPSFVSLIRTPTPNPKYKSVTPSLVYQPSSHCAHTFLFKVLVSMLPSPSQTSAHSTTSPTQVSPNPRPLSWHPHNPAHALPLSTISPPSRPTTSGPKISFRNRSFCSNSRFLSDGPG